MPTSIANRLLVALLALILLVVGLIFLISLTTGPEEIPLIGARERIRLVTPRGEVVVVARIDTGADMSSIDATFARDRGIEPGANRVVIVTAEGREERPVAKLTFVLGDRRIVTAATLEDRSNLSTLMLVGRTDLEGFRIDPAREFVTLPQAGTASRLPFLGGFNNVRIEKFLITIPIMGAVVVLMRLLVGFRTYGVFGPVVIALTLVHLGVFRGIIVYGFLLGIGISVQFLVLTRLRLPHVAQFSLTMFVLVLALVGISAIPAGVTVSFGGAFFPLIITAHLIEQATQNIEEHRFVDSISVLFTTLATAVVLGFYGSYLLTLSDAVLWIVFAVSILAVIAAGQYLGLRLTELFRFKFLKRTHVHK